MGLKKCVRSVWYPHPTIIIRSCSFRKVWRDLCCSLPRNWESLFVFSLTELLDPNLSTSLRWREFIHLLDLRLMGKTVKVKALKTWQRKLFEECLNNFKPFLASGTLKLNVMGTMKKSKSTSKKVIGFVLYPKDEGRGSR